MKLRRLKTRNTYNTRVDGRVVSKVPSGNVGALTQRRHPLTLEHFCELPQGTEYENPDRGIPVRYLQEGRGMLPPASCWCLCSGVQVLF